MMGKRKRAKENRALLLRRARQLSAIINSLEAQPCDNDCDDHLMWGCSALATQEPSNTDHTLEMGGSVYPDGGWTAEITEPADPANVERMAFVPVLNLLVWENAFDHARVKLKLEEIPALMVGEIPNT